MLTASQITITRRLLRASKMMGRLARNAEVEN